MPKRMPAYTVIVNRWERNADNTRTFHAERIVKNFNDSNRAETYAQRMADKGLDVEVVNNHVHPEWEAWNMLSIGTR